MKAIVAHAARDLRIEGRDEPEPGPGEVLIRVARGGICGSDLHYYRHGGFGTVRLREPMVLGHEVAGRVEALGAGVAGPAPGTLVAVSPSRPCYDCALCREGRQNHCPSMRFYGSAMPFPHVQGAFREWLLADPRQLAVADGLDPAAAAMAEPLAVVLHAKRRAGDLTGRRVLVTGAGPIGQLAVMVARAAGAVEVIATDVAAFPLEMARAAGADAVHDMREDPDALAPYGEGKGRFDVLFECSGAAEALAGAVPALRPGAVAMQLGLGGDMTLPVQAMTAREIELRGSFRFHATFFEAVDMMRAGRLDPTPLVTRTMPLDDAVAAFDLASDRTRAIKVQIAFG